MNIKNFLVILGLVGFVIALGTAGASDLDLITAKELFPRIVLSLTMMATSFLGIKAYNQHLRKTTSYKYK